MAVSDHFSHNCFVDFFVALRPCVSSPFDIVDDTFSPWKQPIVQHALSQVIYELPDSKDLSFLMCSL